MMVPTHASHPSGRKGLEVHDLQIGELFAELPDLELLKSQLFRTLGVGQNSSIEELAENRGGLNEGVWILRDSAGRGEDADRCLIMKVVSGQRGEADKFLRLSQRYPSIVDDRCLAFPTAVFRCMGQDGSRLYDVIVMRKARGSPLPLVIASKWHSGRSAEIPRILELVGGSLADFHSRYVEAQHADFQASNVFYDEATGGVTIIDAAEMGRTVRESDVERFCKSLHLIASAPGSYGQQYAAEGARQFRSGYSLRRRSGSKSPA